MQTTLLTDEAMGLCRALYLAQLAEEARRDRSGRRIGDAQRIARLEQLRRRAADRWRRRAGFDVTAGAVAGQLTRCWPAGFWWPCCWLLAWLCSWPGWCWCWEGGCHDRLPTSLLPTPRRPWQPARPGATLHRQC